MSTRRRLALAGSLALVLAAPAHVAAQTMIVCPADARYAFRPRDDGGRIEYCEAAGARFHGPYLATDGEAANVSRGQFRGGKADGRWSAWHADGRAAGEAEFAAGELRRLVAWNADGVLVFQANAAAGRPIVLDRGKLAQDAALNQAVAAQEFVKTMFFFAAGGSPAAAALRLR